MVTRPKSIATVVVVLPVPGSSRSVCSVAAVIHDSVLIGGISEMAPTEVVLPTPKPPAMTILADVICRYGASGELEKPGTKSLQKLDVLWGIRRPAIVVHHQLAEFQQIGEK